MGGSKEEEGILRTQKRERGPQSRSPGLGRSVEGRQEVVPKVSFFAFLSGSSGWVWVALMRLQ